jgi:ribonuclease BN (tRNA processing enzyme)
MSGLTFIGTSDAFGSGGRRQSAILFTAPNGSVLLDCGTTTNTGLLQLGLSPRAIDAILISHFHGDHFGGIPLFILAAHYQNQRKEPLIIAGPPGIEGRVRRLAEAMGHRLKDHEFGFKLSFEELATDRECEVGPVVTRAFATHHQPASCPHGLIVRAGQHRVAYSGDTGWFDQLPREVAGSDVFVCECTFAQASYEFHLDLETLTARREEFDCGRMILTHLGTEMSERRGHCELETADDGLELSF